MKELQDAPMPGTTHPAFAAHEFTIRRWLHGELEYGSQYELRILKPPRLELSRYMPGEDCPATSVSMETFDLWRLRCVAPAPYVGEPYMLTWDVAVDQLGRTVAGLTTYEPIPIHVVASWMDDAERASETKALMDEVRGWERWLQMVDDERFAEDIMTVRRDTIETGETP